MLDLSSRKSLMASLPKGLVIAEMGVANGHFSEQILEAAEPSRLYLIDCWKYQPPDIDPASAPQVAHDERHQNVCWKFRGYPNVTIMRAFSVDAAQQFADSALDVVYLDANHCDVGRDIEAWWPKVREGGWLMGHDYLLVAGYYEVKPVVDEWVNRMGLPMQVAGLNSNNDYPTWIVEKPNAVYT